MADVLRYWRAIELFDPQTIPRVTRPGARRKSGRELVQEIEAVPGRPLSPLPWEPGHPIHGEPPESGRYGASWRHTVFGGVFPVSAVHDALAERFGSGSEEQDYGGRRKSGDTALFAFTVDERGCLLEGTVVLNACAWATGRIFDPGPGAPGWLDGFEKVGLDCEQAVDLLTRRHIPYTLPLPPSAGSAAAAGQDPTGRSTAGWRRVVREILGSSAEGAVLALIGGLAAGPLGAVGAGLAGGAVKPLLRRLNPPDAGGDGRRAAESEDAEHAGGPDPERPADGPPAESDGASDEDAPGDARPVQLPDLVAFAAHVAHVCGVPDLVGVDRLKIRVESRPVARKKDGSLPEPEPAFLNSLFPPDLERVASDSAGYGSALAAYLRDPALIDARDRCDVRTDPAIALVGTEPLSTPAGRWPAPVEHPLALSQQFAVNTIVTELMDGSGIFSVNGPPGTGKSTLLRDLIAAIVVERATELARLPRPQAAFRGTRTWAVDGRIHTVHLPVPAVTGFEIVVASSNNGAVENITAELPSLDAIGEEWRPEASYFVDQASALLGGAPAWGAVAAPLGNQAKRNEFAQRFWWGGRSGTGMQRLLQNLEQDGALHDPPAAERFPEGHTGDAPAPVPPGTAPTPTGWQDAVRRFQAALEHEAELRRDRQEAFHALTVLAASPWQETAAEADRLEQQWLREQRQYQHADMLTGTAAAAMQQVEAALAAHAQVRPGGLRARFGSARQMWDEVEQRLRGDYSQRHAEWRGAYNAAQDAAARVSAARAAAERARREAQRLKEEEEGARDWVAYAREQWSDWFPGDLDEWAERSEEDREKSAPWADPDWMRARTRVFLAALDLHRAFTAGAAGTIRRNLLHLTRTLKREPGAPPPDAELAAWQTLFLVMPVVSTTFASCGRLLESLGSETLGWVLIDEAGQATPQAAAGALWRARRAVVVGDPLQLEPVIQVPEAVQELLRVCYEVAPEWLPARGSAQALADRVNRWGTNVPTRRPDGEPAPVWVGAPLRVHRRCEKPMFSVSNGIAYGGLMVYGTHEAPFPGEDQDPYPGSCWVDVTSDDAEGNWVPAEGLALARMLTKLHREAGVDLDRIRVLSPFRNVVAGCRRTVRDLDWTHVPPPGAVDYRAQTGEFIDKCIGTVHTMQGKEADVVFLVLGTHARRGGGARKWAAETPNLLNVAVSRAKRRLFVIGDHDQWRDLPYFETLADALPRRPWPPSGI
ncbi:DEAD/DEAH box helicase [Actinomadura opuntiae]|uniref:DEAD/DEAH box helicase n=1 Tax=Actinomadura sp. OS1-43 TaxID=604315 RepID=UPI00255B3C97|nr:AAA domain-containing protein [Actinomadura sp. OS1-43]MDL4820792.1 AAA domain-containing protein [Actinomadura sp. OS1-43]